MITPSQYQRSKRLQVDDTWTRFVREHYPPAERESVVVAYDPFYRGGRWVLAYDTSDLVATDDGVFSQVRYVKAFYIWQGAGDTFLLPSSTMVDWLRDHDCFSGEYVGEWEDRMFGGHEAEKERQEESRWDDFTYGLKQLHDRYGKLLPKFTTSHNMGLGPNRGSKHFLVGTKYGGWKS